MTALSRLRLPFHRAGSIPGMTILNAGRAGSILAKSSGARNEDMQRLGFPPDFVLPRFWNLKSTYIPPIEFEVLAGTDDHSGVYAFELPFNGTITPRMVVSVRRGSWGDADTLPTDDSVVDTMDDSGSGGLDLTKRSGWDKFMKGSVPVPIEGESYLDWLSRFLKGEGEDTADTDRSKAIGKRSLKAHPSVVWVRWSGNEGSRQSNHRDSGSEERSKSADTVQSTAQGSKQAGDSLGRSDTSIVLDTATHSAQPTSPGTATRSVWIDGMQRFISNRHEDVSQHPTLRATRPATQDTETQGGTALTASTASTADSRVTPPSTAL